MIRTKVIKLKRLKVNLKLKMTHRFDLWAVDEIMIEMICL